jgi:RecA-family ATPase
VAANPIDDADLEQLKAQARQWLDETKRAERIREALENSQFKLRSITDVLANPTRPKWLLRDTLEENVLALMAGPRGTYKSFIALHWSMLVALAGFEVLLISAEGAGIDRRIRAWLMRHAPSVDPSTLKVTILERRVNFNAPAEVADLVETIETLELKPKLVVIDTLSKNSGGLDENSNSEVKEFIGFIDNGIRRRFDCTVLLLHHTGHSEQGRARGASALEADTDAAYVIKREPGTRIVSVSRERFKDSADLEPLVYQAEIIDLGDRDEFDQPVSSIALVPATAEVVSSRADSQPRGARQKELLRVLKRLAEEAGTELIWTSADLARIARDAGMARATARDAAAGLTGFYLVSTVGGYRLKRPGE